MWRILNYFNLMIERYELLKCVLRENIAINELNKSSLLFDTFLKSCKSTTYTISPSYKDYKYIIINQSVNE